MNREEARERWNLFDRTTRKILYQAEVDHIAHPDRATRLEAYRNFFDAGYEAGSEGRWVPIESAPKDGSAIVLLSKPYEMDAGPNGVSHIPAKAAIGRWNEEGSSWVAMGLSPEKETYELQPTGVWSSGGGWFQPDEVSHWMPLPPAYKED